MTRKIRTLMVIGLTAVAAGLSGCFIESGSSSNSCASSQYVTFTWEIVKDANDVPLTCGQANSDLIVMDLNGTPFEFPCPFSSFGGTGRTTPVPEGLYPTFLQLISTTDQVLSVTPTTSVPVPRCAPASLGVVTFGAP